MTIGDDQTLRYGMDGFWKGKHLLLSKNFGKQVGPILSRRVFLLVPDSAWQSPFVVESHLEIHRGSIRLITPHFKFLRISSCCVDSPFPRLLVTTWSFWEHYRFIFFELLKKIPLPISVIPYLLWYAKCSFRNKDRIVEFWTSDTIRISTPMLAKIHPFELTVIICFLVSRSLLIRMTKPANLRFFALANEDRIFVCN